MRSFSIKELERLCGVNAHVIRTWEKRFNILNPNRQGNNIRQYTLEDVERLANVALLLENGYRISLVANLPSEEIEMRLSQIKSDNVRQQRTANKLVQYMFKYDTDQFEAELDNAVMSWGINDVINNVVISFLEKTDLFSYKDTTIETHFAVTMIRRKLIFGIEKLQPVTMNGQSVLLYLPEGEHYDLVLLYLDYVLRRQGHKVIYLGTNISLFNLDNAITQKKPNRLCTYVTNKRVLPVRQYAEILRTYHPHLTLCVVYADKEMIETEADNEFVFYRKYNLL